MNKLNVGDKFIIPSGTELFFINLQQRFITTKKYVIIVTSLDYGNDSYILGNLYDIVNEYSFPNLLKMCYGEVSCDLSKTLPIDDILSKKLKFYI